MIFLKFENRKAHFILPSKEVEPEKLTRDELFEILNIVFNNYNSIDFPASDEFNSIANPIEREIVEQITAKIKEFHNNVPGISKEIQNQFPNLDQLVQD